MAKLPEKRAVIIAKISKEEAEKVKFEEFADTDEDRRRRLLLILSRDYHLYREYLSEEEALKFSIQTLEKQRERWTKKTPDKLKADCPKLVMKAYMLSLDPHSEYMDEEDVEQFETSMQREFFGIGVQIRGAPLGAQVIEVIKGGPAGKDGRLQPSDQIIKVDDEVLAGQPLSQIVRRIKGQKGTQVRLTLRKAAGPGNEQRLAEIELVRDTIDLTTLKVVGKRFESAAGPVGAISVQSFYNGVSGDVADRIRQLNEPTPLAGLVLDLRNNTGGLLTEARDMAGLFIHAGPIVGEQGARGPTRWLYDPDENLVFAKPLVVLVNQFSASASEIVAGALRDYGRAVIVGSSQTHGKGTVQRIQDLDMAGVPGKIKVTFMQWFLAGGDSVQIKGVVPDISIPGMKVIEEFLEKGYEGAVPASQVESRLNPQHPDLKFYSAWKAGVLPKLIERSAKRVKENKDFDLFRQAEKGEPPPEPKPKKEELKDPQLEEAAHIAGDAAEGWKDPPPLE